MMMMVMIMMRIALDILTKVCHQLVMMKILQLPFCGISYPIYDLVGLLSVFNYLIILHQILALKMCLELIFHARRKSPPVTDVRIVSIFLFSHRP